MKPQALYIMENETGLVKIGISHNPERRRRQVSNASGLSVRLIHVWSAQELKNAGYLARDMEKRLHGRYGDYRRSGEWFDPVVLELGNGYTSWIPTRHPDPEPEPEPAPRPEPEPMTLTAKITLIVEYFIGLCFILGMLDVLLK